MKDYRFYKYIREPQVMPLLQFQMYTNSTSRNKYSLQHQLDTKCIRQTQYSIKLNLSMND